MAELAAADLSAFTRGRLPDDDATQQVLDAALAAARRYCGWHVCPVRTDVQMEVDGSGAALSLPTLNLIAVSEIVEDGVSLDVADLYWSQSKGVVYKRGWSRGWSGASILVTMTHGFSESEAADWRRAVLRLADQMSFEPSTGEREGADVRRKRVDDVELEWFAEGLITADTRMSNLFTAYRILPAP